jgi:hypothetical protein
MYIVFKANSIFGMAIKILFLCKFNRESQEYAKPKIEIEAQRRCAWYCYVMDKYGQMTQGLPCTLHEENFALPLPASEWPPLVDNEFATIDSENILITDAIFGVPDFFTAIPNCSISFLGHSAILAKILGNVFKSVCRPNDESIHSKSVLTQSLFQWYQSLPLVVRNLSLLTMDYMELLLVYHYAILKLYQSEVFNLLKTSLNFNETKASSLYFSSISSVSSLSQALATHTTNASNLNMYVYLMYYEICLIHLFLLRSTKTNDYFRIQYSKLIASFKTVGQRSKLGNSVVEAVLKAEQDMDKEMIEKLLSVRMNPWV